MVKFSNPRLIAEIQDYPIGAGKRGLCVFKVEHNAKKGYRFTRQTTGKVKTATYGGKACIVDGDNGKTYLLQCAGIYGFITISRSDFKDAPAAEVGAASVFPESNAARFDELNELIKQANATPLATS